MAVAFRKMMILLPLHLQAETRGIALLVAGVGFAKQMGVVTFNVVVSNLFKRG